MTYSRLFRLLAAVSLVLMLSVPGFAEPSDLAVRVVGYGGNVVTVTVHNPNSEAETARVALTVRLDNDTLETITSSNFTVLGGATLSVAVTASRTVSVINDGPDPLPPF